MPDSLDSPAMELVTETSWIVGRLSPEQSSHEDDLRSVLNLEGYGLTGRSLIESGRLVDVLNRDEVYLSVDEATVVPHLAMKLLERSPGRLAVSRREVLWAAPAPPGRLQVRDRASRLTSADQVERERTRVELQLGPMLVRGDLHVVPGSDPVAFFFRRELKFVPLTAATATYLPDPGQEWTRSVIIVNVRRTQFLATLQPDERPNAAGTSGASEAEIRSPRS